MKTGGKKKKKRKLFFKFPILTTLWKQIDILTTTTRTGGRARCPSSLWRITCPKNTSAGRDPHDRINSGNIIDKLSVKKKAILSSTSRRGTYYSKRLFHLKFNISSRSSYEVFDSLRVVDARGISEKKNLGPGRRRIYRRPVRNFQTIP